MASLYPPSWILMIQIVGGCQMFRWSRLFQESANDAKMLVQWVRAKMIKFGATVMKLRTLAIHAVDNLLFNSY